MNLEINMDILTMIIFLVGLVVITFTPIYLIYSLIEFLVNLTSYLKSQKQLNQLQILQQKQKQTFKKKIKDDEIKDENQFKTE
ncbi:hypothetical protein [Candidatus Phytoplasma sacchari]|uniref:Transmembrane protein n=1 Tax=Candidatus Phytoplasma sacchari TaxID=2609813 RepID=A0ABY7M1Z6_9MOLU|nr:hypothetical protein O7R10_01840 [Candidatus Phytoplasma sacchari]